MNYNLVYNIFISNVKIIDFDMKIIFKCLADALACVRSLRIGKGRYTLPKNTCLFMSAFKDESFAVNASESKTVNKHMHDLQG